MATIKPKRTAGGVVYKVRWKFRGRGRQRTCPDAKTARTLKREVEAAIALGRDWEALQDAAPDLMDCLTHYLKHRMRVGMARATALQCKSVFERLVTYLRDTLRRTPTALDLTRPNLERWLDHLAMQPGRLGRQRVSASTLNTACARIQAAWAWLYDREEYEGDIARPRKLDLVRAARIKQGRAPTWAQIDAVIGELSGWRQEALIISRYTGLRIGQSTRLQWSDVDFERALLTIRPELGKTRREKRGRVVPVSSHLLEYLAGRGAREGFLVPDMGNGRRPETSALQLRAAWARTGAPEEVYSGQTTHCARVALITWLRAQHYDEAVVGHLVGHRARDGSAVTDDVYLDVRSAFWSDCVEAVSKIPRVGAAGTVVSIRRTEVGDRG